MLQLFEANVTTLGGRIGSSLAGNPFNMCLRTRDNGNPIWLGPNLYFAKAGGGTIGHIDAYPAVNVLVAHEPIEDTDNVPVVRPYTAR